MASGAGMEISHIGCFVVKTHNHNLYLNNVHYVPRAKKKHVSAHRYAYDNFAFLEVYSNFSLSRIIP